MDNETPVPVELKPAQVGMREATLLVLAASYAALMFNMQEVAVIGGWLAVALVVVAQVRGPRPTGLLLFVYGLGLFLMLFWWPREHWWQAAIGLLWIGIGLMVVGAIKAVLARWSRR
jgi:hypothetical protein